ncbi:MAG: hypothetical protein IKO68_00530 [Oscillospiraceae bacterium]|nr:hypothetical protein [Oscillospiraceae bacterium]
MPPRGHSSSSHSSSFHSSGSSFRSSSFRSSGSSARGPSSHSSSSYSSRPSFSGRSTSFSKPASGKGPSQHSSSSWTSAPAASAPAPRPHPATWRPRVNQPTGFVTATHQRPIYYYGRRHSYAYYPLAWVDVKTGTSYQQGYYDENGQRYDSVTFEENGNYKNVVCHCPYCDSETVMDLSAGEVEDHSLKCPNCGGTMEIRSELDSILSEDAAREESAAASQASYDPEIKRKKSRGYFWIIVAMVIMILGISRSMRRHQAQTVSPDIPGIQIIENTGASGQEAALYAPVYLEKQADGSYHVVTDVVRADKVLYFDADADSYYDEDTDCWLWKNTDMDPAVWQYWYEDISSDYESGWMEHDDDGWHIETTDGKWVSLPAKYNSDRLWYIE